MAFTKRTDGVIVDENGIVATAEMLQVAGIDPALQIQKVSTEEPVPPTIENLQAQLRHSKQENMLLQSKADGFDDLVQNPKFQRWAYEQEQGPNVTPTTQPATQPNTQTPNLEEDFSGFEDGPGLVKLIKTITEQNMTAFKAEILPELDKRSAARLDPLLNNLAANQQQAEFQTLVSQAQSGKWSVAPESIQKEIDFQRTRVPGLTMNQAYDLVVANMERRGIVTRSPVDTQNAAQGNPNAVQSNPNVVQGNPLIQPTGGGGAPVVSASASENKLDASLQERADGKSFARRTGEDIIKEAAALLELPIDVNTI